MFSRSVCSGHCFCTETSFVFTQQLALWRVQVRHSASWKARSLLFSLPENGSACVSSHGRFGVSSLRLLCQRAGANALHKERVSLCSASGGTRTTLCDRTKSAVLGARRSPLKILQPRGGVFRDTGASMRICFHRECFCMQTVTQSASRLTVTPCNAHTPHAGTSTRGEGKRHRSGQARTHRRFRSRARDRNLRSGTNTNSTAFRRCSDRSEPRSR